MGQIRSGLLLSIVALALAAGPLPAQPIDSTAASGDADGGFPDLWLNFATALGSAAVAAFAAYLKFRMDLAQFRLHFQDQLLDSKTIGIIKDRGHFIDDAQHRAVEEQIRTHGTKFGEAGNRSERIEDRLERMSSQLAGHGEKAHTTLVHLQQHDIAIAEIRIEFRGIDTALQAIRGQIDRLAPFVTVEQFTSQVARIDDALMRMSTSLEKRKREDPQMLLQVAEAFTREVQRLHERQPRPRDPEEAEEPEPEPEERHEDRSAGL